MTVESRLVAILIEKPAATICPVKVDDSRSAPGRIVDTVLKLDEVMKIAIKYVSTRPPI